jgi:hypothetical protein
MSVVSSIPRSGSGSGRGSRAERRDGESILSDETVEVEAGTLQTGEGLSVVAGKEKAKGLKRLSSLMRRGHI